MTDDDKNSICSGYRRTASVDSYGYIRIDVTPTPTSETNYACTGVADDASDGHPTNRCAVQCRRRVGNTSTSSNADSADDFYVNIAGAEAVADASTTRAPNAADVGRSASPTRRSAKLLPTC